MLTTTPHASLYFLAAVELCGLSTICPMLTREQGSLGLETLSTSPHRNTKLAPPDCGNFQCPRLNYEFLGKIVSQAQTWEEAPCLAHTWGRPSVRKKDILLLLWLSPLLCGIKINTKPVASLLNELGFDR